MLLSQFLPFEYREGIWDEAADYMRKNQSAPNSNLFKLSQQIEQRDMEGNLINTYAISELINKMLSSDEFLGCQWSTLIE